MKQLFKISLVLIVFMLLLIPTAAGAGEPTDEIRTTVDRGISVLNDENLSQNAKAEQIARLRKIVRPLFDFEGMARRSLGSHWRDITPEDRTEFVRVFTDLLEKNYVDKMGFYKGGEMKYINEVVDEDYARVDVIVKTSTWADFAVSYKLRRENGSWRIYDILVENVSLINSYRVQFSRIITRESYRDLVKKMKQKLS